MSKLKINHRTLICSVFIVLCSLFSGIKAQQFKFESGLPHIINYTAKQYKAHDQNWSLVQDSLGIIYIGNNTRLIVFDGVEFEVIPTESSIYSLAKDEKGNIYYGGDGDFGIIQPNESGKLKLNSFVKKIPKDFSSFAEVWSVKCIYNMVLFSTKEHIYILKDNAISVVNPAKGSGIHKCFELKNNYLAREIGGGLSYYANAKLNFIKGSELFEETMVDFVQEVDGKIIIGTRKNGFYEMEWNPKSNPELCKITSLEFPVGSYLEEGELYHGILLSNKNLCFATKNNGIFISDKLGNLIEHYTEEKGLLNNRVWFVMEDKNKNLWAASNKGISMIDYLTPIRLYNNIQGLSGYINNVNVINNKLYINSDLGLFEGKETKDGLKFIANPNFKNPSFSITQFTLKSTHDLIVCAKTGLSAIRGNQIYSIEEGIEFYKSLQSKKYPQLLVVAGKNLITVYEYKNNKYNLVSEFEYASQFRFIIEDEDGNIWISGNNKTLVKINLNKQNNILYQLVPLTDIPAELKSEIFLFIEKHKIFICSTNGIFEIKPSDKGIYFEKSTYFPKALENNYVFRTYLDSKQRYWLAYDRGNMSGNLAQFDPAKKSPDNFNPLFLNKYQGIQKNGFSEDKNGNIWIATNEGLLKYNTNEVMFHKHSFPVYIKEITLKNDSSFNLTRGLIPEILKNKLSFDLNGISFKYTVANYSGVDDLVFSSRLIPFEKDFGEWVSSRSKDYNYLPEGTYTLEVKAKDIFKNISNTKRLTFEIAPPWYRNSLAYISYFIIVVALVYVLVKYNTKRLRAVNDLLEKTVKERTHELWEERDKLSEANHEITDSINYAKIIQQSILPDVKTFNYTFKDSFIYFRPRNIVSGDFYWFNLVGSHKKSMANVSQHIIVAADCTGHGVPGAFMSMIGSEKLNQSIAEIADLTPANILSFMNRQIKDSLKQDEGNSQSKDGMEISLCFLDTDTNILTFAGANRPLWIYRKGCTLESVEIIKPTKAGIAGHTHVDQVFEETEIQLYPGDTFYMFTDGAPDQFGGPKNKKLTTKGFRQLLFDIQSQSLAQQAKSIHGYYRSWMGNANEQVDDILIMGIRI